MYVCKNCNREINREWRQTPSGIYTTIKSRETFRKNKEVSINRDDFIEWYNSQPKICGYCDLPEKYGDLMRKYFGAHGVRLTVDCIDNDKGYVKDNLILACDRCNFIKSNIFTYDEMRFIGQNYIKPKWRSFPEITKQSKEVKE